MHAKIILDKESSMISLKLYKLIILILVIKYLIKS